MAIIEQFLKDILLFLEGQNTGGERDRLLTQARQLQLADNQYLALITREPKEETSRKAIEQMCRYFDSSEDN